MSDLLQSLWPLALLVGLNVIGFYVLRGSPWRWISLAATLVGSLLLGLIVSDDPPAGCHFARSNAPVIADIDRICGGHHDTYHGSASGIGIAH